MLNTLNYPICCAIPERVCPSAWEEHVPFGMFLVDALKPRVLVELGTHFGYSYCGFCQAVKALNLGTNCFAIDTWIGDAHAGHYGHDVLSDLRRHHDPLYHGFSTLLQSTFDDALPYFGDATIDLLHIDGFHSYEVVKHDFESWLPKMSERGVILLHDTNVRERGFGVRRFWDEIRARYPHFEFIHGHGLGLVAVGTVDSEPLRSMFEATDDEVARLRKFFSHLGSTLSASNRVRELNCEWGQLRAEQEQVVRARAESHTRETALGKTVEELSARLVEQERIFRERDAENTRTLEAMAARLAERESALARVSTTLAERECALRGLGVEKAQAIEAFSARLFERSQAAEAATAQVREIESSLAWKVANTLRRARVAVAPFGTWRWRILRTAKSGAIAWKQGGIRNVISKVSAKLGSRFRYERSPAHRSGSSRTRQPIPQPHRVPDYSLSHARGDEAVAGADGETTSCRL